MMARLKVAETRQVLAVKPANTPRWSWGESNPRPSGDERS